MKLNKANLVTLITEAVREGKSLNAKDKKSVLKNKNKSKLKENVDLQNTDDTVQTEVSRYLSMESADQIISEIEKEVSKTVTEVKMQKLKEIIEAIDQKVSSLEEDSNVKDYVNPSKIKEMRATSKKLRMMQEKMEKDYTNKYMKKTKK